MSLYEPRSELDLLAVQRDDAQLDELARRQAREPVADGALALLAALTVEVDTGLDDLLATPLRVPVRSELPAGVRGISEVGRRRAARVATAALIVTSLASVSGISAAVTGDPFSPYRSVISSVSGDDEGLPAPRITDAEVQDRIRAIDASIDAGQLGRAHSGVQHLRATLDQRPGGARRSVLARLTALEAKIARALARNQPEATQVPPPAKDKVVPPKGSGTSNKPSTPPGRLGQDDPTPAPPPRATPSQRTTPKAAPKPATTAAAEPDAPKPTPAKPAAATAAAKDDTASKN